MGRSRLRLVSLCLLIVCWLIVLKLYQFNGRGYANSSESQTLNDDSYASIEAAAEEPAQGTLEQSQDGNVVQFEAPGTTEASRVPEPQESIGNVVQFESPSTTEAIIVPEPEKPIGNVVQSESPATEDASIVREPPASAGDSQAPVKSDLAHQELTADDIAVIMRTGWQVRDRLNGSLSTFLKDRSPDTLAIFADREFNIPGYTVHDAMKPFFERLPQYFGNSTQKKIYDDIQKLEGGVLKSIPGEHNDGWKLDILKQPMSADLGYHMLRKKRSFKWWVIIDDDTYLHLPSIIPALAEKSPSENHYFGMPTGFDQITYAQGGSGILLSDGAMEQLFGDRDFADAMHIKGLKAVYGDYNLAAHLSERSVYLDQALALMFHEHPLADIRWPIRDICTPLVSAHHMQPSAMHNFSNMIRFHDRPLLIGDLLNEIGIADLAYRTHHSYSLGRADLLPSVLSEMSSKEIEQSGGKQVNVVIIDHNHPAQDQPKMCQHLCHGGQIRAQCAAWTFIPETGECHLSDEIILNLDQPRQDSISGILTSIVAEHHLRNCPHEQWMNGHRD